MNRTDEGATVDRLRLTRLAVALTLAIGVTVVSPDVAVATPTVGCRGSGCNGKNPVAMRCAADAVSINKVVDEDRASGGTFGRQVVTLRYSRRCNASWARVTSSAGGTAAVTSAIAYMGGYKTSTKRTMSGAGSIYSKMRSGSAINACGRTSFNNGAVVKTNCATAG